MLSFQIYTKLAKWLTDMENHRTENEFDTAYIYKMYALAFTNNYSPVFYIAFLKVMFLIYCSIKSVIQFEFALFAILVNKQLSVMVRNVKFFIKIAHLRYDSPNYRSTHKNSSLVLQK